MERKNNMDEKSKAKEQFEEMIAKSPLGKFLFLHAS